MTEFAIIRHPPSADGRTFYGVRQTHPDGSSTTWNTGQGVEAAEALYAEIMASQRCVECGDPQAGKWDEGTMQQMADRQLCFSCNHWLNMLAHDATRQKAVAVIDAYHFTIAPDLSGRSADCAGHGGRRFDIRFMDGRTVTTRNLWAQGRIPEHFHARFPNNAEFVSREAIGYVGAPGGGYQGSGSAHNV